jgi:uncharacterized protein YndB with AHSA1/START domain
VNGELTKDGDRWRLRFTRKLPHAQEKVWRALTEAEHLQAWFPQRISGQWTSGAPLRFEHAGDAAPAFEGEVLACVPPSLLEFRWGTDTLRFEVHAEGSESVLVLTDTFDELGKAARDAAGWHACLDLLEQHLTGAQPSWTAGDRWAAVHPQYVADLGPAASTIGPPS